MDQRPGLSLSSYCSCSAGLFGEKPTHQRLLLIRIAESANATPCWAPERASRIGSVRVHPSRMRTIFRARFRSEIAVGSYEGRFSPILHATVQNNFYPDFPYLVCE